MDYDRGCEELPWWTAAESIVRGARAFGSPNRNRGRSPEGRPGKTSLAGQELVNHNSHKKARHDAGGLTSFLVVGFLIDSE